ncbi:MAG: YdeI/OmpD-associated family protein [Chloroflexi bacterium]|nr:YdeI/OmpD-associated family protein [Chloroflexota bacterium]
MPVFVRQALMARGLLDAYAARPPYQRNDYLGWIGRAARPSTRQRRLEQMLDELKLGDIYMKMTWRSPDRKTRRTAKGGEAKKRPNR